MIRAYVSGDEQELADLANEMYEELQPRMIRAVEAGAAVLHGTVRQLLSRITPEDEKPTPGGPPARRTGELHDAIQVRPGKKRGLSVVASVGVWHPSPKERSRIARKAAALEYGGRDQKGRVHPPYPFMRPAEQASAEEVRAAVDAELDRPG